LQFNSFTLFIKNALIYNRQFKLLKYTADAILNPRFSKNFSSQKVVSINP